MTVIVYCFYRGAIKVIGLSEVGTVYGYKMI